MSAATAARVAELRADGPKRFGRWDAALFDAVAAGPAGALAGVLAGQPDADAVLAGYLKLAQQAVGTGLVTRAAPGAAGWSSFLERLLVETVPARLAAVAPGRRLAVLVEVWNFGEGLLREPAWVDRYVNACAPSLKKLDDLEGFLVRALERVLTPAPAAAWSGPFRIDVLDLRKFADDFLPGHVRLAAPTVVCVEDRRRPELQIGIFLRQGHEAEVLGVVSGLGEYAEPAKLPGVQFDDGAVRVAGKSVPVPTLRRCHAFAVARSGFVAASVADSQRLWVVAST